MPKISVSVMPVPAAGVHAVEVVVTQAGLIVHTLPLGSTPSAYGDLIFTVAPGWAAVLPSWMY